MIDHTYQVTEIAKAAIEVGLSIKLMIEVGNDLVELIECIKKHACVSYAGIQAYSDHVQHVKVYENRKVEKY